MKRKFCYYVEHKHINLYAFMSFPCYAFCVVFIGCFAEL